MISRYFLHAPCICGKSMQNNLPVMLSAILYPHNTLEQVRYMGKHWNPVYKKDRKEKFIKINLPNFMNTDEDTEQKKRTFMKKLGLLPQKQWQERPIFISCTPSAFEPYVPPEGDGKFSALSTQGAKQKFTDVTMKGKSLMAIRKIKSLDDTFTLKTFPEEALEIYIKAHEALTAKDKITLREYVTEIAYTRMLHKSMDKTIHWKYLESLEPPRIVQARCTSLVTKENIFAQITVRFHSQQMLCIYDRFGRVLKGSEILRKDVLEYIVFENHLGNQYGKWRLHLKIIPAWMPPRAVGEKTYVLPPEKSEEQSEDVPSSVLDPPEASPDVKEKTVNKEL